MTDQYSKSAVKVSLIHFIFGKALNAIASLLTLVLLARWFPPQDYGVYITFLALQSTLLAVSSLGIDTTAERFLPELRISYADKELLGFVAASMMARFGSLILVALIGWFAAHSITNLVGIGIQVDAFKLWLLVIVLTGILSLSVVLLEAMLYQRQAQLCMSVYVVAKLLLLVLTKLYLVLDIVNLIQIELISTAIAAIVGVRLLFQRYSVSGLNQGWQVLLQNQRRIKRFAFFNYIAQIAFQLFNAEVMKVLVTRLLGVLQIARYGFAYSLADTVQRYLPAVLLLRLIKPVFVSRYTKTGDSSQLNEMARIILKLNLLTLIPIIAISAAFGADLLSILSNGKYADAHWLLVGVLTLLILSSHQLVLSLLASTLEKNSMQLYAGLASTVGFPCALYFIPNIGAYGAIVASAVSGVVYNIFATIYLRRTGFNYQPDVRGAAVFFVAGAIMYGTLMLIQHYLPRVIGVAVALVLSSIAYLVIVRVMSAFSNAERDLLNSVLPKRIFIF